MGRPRFTTYRTYYELFCDHRPSGGKWRKTFRRYYDEAREKIPGLVDRMSEKAEATPDQKLGEILIHQCTHIVESYWYRLGRPVFKVWPGLCAALAHTSIDVETERFNVPFPAFKIDLPRDNRVAESCGMPHVDGMLVYDGEFGIEVEGRDWDEGTMGRQLTILYFERDTFAESLDGGHRMIRALIEMDGLCVGSVPQVLMLQMLENHTIKECLEKLGDGVKGMESVDHNVPREQRDRLRRHLLGIAVATSLIAISDDKRLIKPEKRGVRHALKSAKRRKRGDASSHDRKGWDVGADIKLPKDYTRVLRDEDDGVGERLKFGHVRSGHLRLQSHGLRTDPKYKVIFISPTVVRPDLPMKPKLTQRAVKG